MSHPSHEELSSQVCVLFNTALPPEFSNVGALFQVMDAMNSAPSQAKAATDKNPDQYEDILDRPRATAPDEPYAWSSLLTDPDWDPPVSGSAIALRYVASVSAELGLPEPPNDSRQPEPEPEPEPELELGMEMDLDEPEAEPELGPEMDLDDVEGVDRRDQQHNQDDGASGELGDGVGVGVDNERLAREREEYAQLLSNRLLTDEYDRNGELLAGGFFDDAYISDYYEVDTYINAHLSRPNNL
ncbi:hypothetical protein F4821DRAFT_221594 [Hypoxylon rubiginosum]|uniref:Uncharacterized protein n=1 Tax=Hypoxylon rubiginosum TaxID=110542 RepID=A0ACC0DM79_9PEZI|nr:hypothetical protein F4821DRAFT_221594 [Hypoxylon rubiginosum]